MNIYRVRATPMLSLSPFRRGGWPQLSQEAVLGVLSDATIRELAPAAPPLAGVVLDVALNRSDHGQALDDLSAALQQLGWQLAESYVQEWVTAEIEGLVAGAGGGGLAGAATKNARLALLAAGLGGLFGYLAGSTRQTLRATYQAHRSYAQWQLVHLTPQPTGLQPQHVG